MKNDLIFYRLPYYWCWLLILGVLVIVLMFPWSPKYFVSGTLYLRPKEYVVKTPCDARVVTVNVHVGQVLRQGTSLFKLKPISALIYENYYHKKQKIMNSLMRKQVLELQYQKKRLQKLKPLMLKNILTPEDYHRWVTRYQSLKFEYYQSWIQLLKLQQDELIDFQAPISGIVTDINIQSQNLVKKNTDLLMIQPIGSHWEFYFKAPLYYQHYLSQNPELRLSLPSEKKIKIYSLHAKVYKISKIIKKDRHGSYLQVAAHILNASNDFVPQMPLDGYLLGTRNSIFRWLITLILEN